MNFSGGVNAYVSFSEYFEGLIRFTFDVVDCFIVFIRNEGFFVFL